MNEELTARGLDAIALHADSYVIGVYVGKSTYVETCGNFDQLRALMSMINDDHNIRELKEYDDELH